MGGSSEMDVRLIRVIHDALTVPTLFHLGQERPISPGSWSEKDSYFMYLSGWPRKDQYYLSLLNVPSLPESLVADRLVAYETMTDTADVPNIKANRKNFVQWRQK